MLRDGVFLPEGSLISASRAAKAGRGQLLPPAHSVFPGAHSSSTAVCSRLWDAPSAHLHLDSSWPRDLCKSLLKKGAVNGVQGSLSAGPNRPENPDGSQAAFPPMPKLAQVNRQHGTHLPWLSPWMSQGSPWLGSNF